MEAALPRTGDDLRALPYHADVVACLRETEPEVWAWAASMSVREQAASDVREHLLRHTYRLGADAHPEPYRLCDLALQRLGIELPATLYQTGGEQMNAALYFLPDHVHVVLVGPLLERLGEPELLALFGHELAHHRLWRQDEGVYAIADRILQHTMADPGAAGSHAETARLWQLSTELFADRGGAIAAGDAHAAVTTLVKVHTGVGKVDAAAYLGQAQEIEAGETGLARGESHPESHLRAQALDRWWRGDAGLDAWLQRRLQGPLGLDRLDLPGQRRLEVLTRSCLTRFLDDPALRSERLLTQAREFFPDWQPGETAGTDDGRDPERWGDSARTYLATVLLDLALADEDLREPALRQALRCADGFAGRAAFLTALMRDGGATRREADRLAKSVPAPASTETGP